MGKRLITPQIADEWLEKHNTDNYRPLLEHRAIRFSRDMRQGNWRYISSQTIKFDVNGVLMDGQKRLRAVVLSETDQYFNIELGCDPEDKFFIDMGMPRTLGNQLANEGIKDPNNMSAAVRLGFDIELFKQGRSPNKPENQSTLHEVLDYIKADDTIEFALSSATSVPSKILRRSIATYCYNVFHKIDAYDCAEFFHKLVELEGIDDTKDKPILQLHKRLVYGHWPTTGRNHRIQVVYTIFRAWNAWRDQEELGKLQLPTQEIKNLKLPEPH